MIITEKVRPMGVVSEDAVFEALLRDNQHECEVCGEPADEDTVDMEGMEQHNVESND